MLFLQYQNRHLLPHCQHGELVRLEEVCIRPQNDKIQREGLRESNITLRSIAGQEQRVDEPEKVEGIVTARTQAPKNRHWDNSPRGLKGLHIPGVSGAVAERADK